MTFSHRFLIIFLTVVGSSLTVSASKFCPSYYGGPASDSRDIVIPRLPISNGSFKVAYDGFGKLEAVLNDQTRISLIDALFTGSFPGNFGVLPKNEIVVGTPTRLMKFRIENGEAIRKIDMEIMPRASFSNWAFSRNGQFAVGLFTRSVDGYQQVYIVDFNRVNRGKTFVIPNTSKDPLQVITILDNGELVAYSETGRQLPLQE